MRYLTVTLMATLLAACGMPKTPTAADVARDGIARSDYAVPDTKLMVSMLSRGPADGRRVIFIHGTPGSAIGFEHFVRSPPPGVEAISIDRPGFGQTRPAEALVSLRAQAAAIAPLLVERQGQWPILVGHSLGGPVAAQVAADNPGRVGGLLILAGSFDPGVEKINPMQYVGEWRGVRSLLSPALRNANRELMSLKPELEALAPRLAGLRCPVIVVHGTKDDLVPYSNAAFLREHLTAASFELRTIAGQNHFLPWNEEARVRAALAALLAKPAAPC